LVDGAEEAIDVAKLVMDARWLGCDLTGDEGIIST